MNTHLTYSDRPTPPYVIIGARVHIHFNEIYEQREDMGEMRGIYSYNEAVCHVNDDRNTILNKIISVGGTVEQSEELTEGWFRLKE